MIVFMVKDSLLSPCIFQKKLSTRSLSLINNILLCLQSDCENKKKALNIKGLRYSGKK